MAVRKHDYTSSCRGESFSLNQKRSGAPPLPRKQQLRQKCFRF
jgi:hypothetical protein